MANGRRLKSVKCSLYRYYMHLYATTNVKETTENWDRAKIIITTTLITSLWRLAVDISIWEGKKNHPLPFMFQDSRPLYVLICNHNECLKTALMSPTCTQLTTSHHTSRGNKPNIHVIPREKLTCTANSAL